MLQVKEVAMSDKYGEEVWPYDIFEVFAAEKKKHQEMASKVHEPTVPLKQASTSVTDFHPSSPNSQFRYWAYGPSLDHLNTTSKYLPSTYAQLMQMSYLFITQTA